MPRCLQVPAANPVRPGETECRCQWCAKWLCGASFAGDQNLKIKRLAKGAPLTGKKPRDSIQGAPFDMAAPFGKFKIHGQNAQKLLQ